MDADLAVRAIGRAIVLPPGGPMLLGAVGFALLRRAPVLGRSLIGAAFLVLLAVSMPVGSNRLANWVERYPPLDLSAPVAADAIVVLAGGIRRDAPLPGQATLTPEPLERLAGGVVVARATHLPMLLSGGRVEPGIAEADVMQEVLVQAFGMQARWLEQRSRTTRENARESAKILLPLGMRRVVLVTSALHLPRAVREFEAAGFTVIPAPTGLDSPGACVASLHCWLPNGPALAQSHAALYEMLGAVVARLDGGR